MKRLTRQLWVLVMLAISVGGHADRWDEAYYEREKKAINDTMAATEWTIEEGIATYYREGGEDGFKDMVKKTRKGYEKFMFGPGAVQVDSESHFAMFFIAAFNSTYNIIALHRETLPGGIYEFWFVKVSAHHRSSDTARSMFYVTRADEVRGRREILHKSDRFIERYEVAPGTVFVFPVDNLEVLWNMAAWRYPESYPDSDLKNMRVSKHWRTGRITVERGDSEQWLYEDDRAGNLMLLSETVRDLRRMKWAGMTISEEEWEGVYNRLVRIINLSGRPIKEKDWKRYYKRQFDKLERLDKTAAKTRFDAKEQLNIEWKDKE